MTKTMPMIQIRFHTHIGGGHIVDPLALTVDLVVLLRSSDTWRRPPCHLDVIISTLSPSLIHPSKRRARISTWTGVWRLPTSSKDSSRKDQMVHCLLRLSISGRTSNLRTSPSIFLDCTARLARSLTTATALSEEVAGGCCLAESEGLQPEPLGSAHSEGEDCVSSGRVRGLRLAKPG